MKKTRVQFDLPANKISEVEELMTATDSETRRELFNNALTLLKWAVEQKRQGYDISSYHRVDKDLHILQMPALNNVQKAETTSGYGGDIGSPLPHPVATQIQ